MGRDADTDAAFTEFAVTSRPRLRSTPTCCAAAGPRELMWHVPVNGRRGAAQYVGRLLD